MTTQTSTCTRPRHPAPAWQPTPAFARVLHTTRAYLALRDRPQVG